MSEFSTYSVQRKHIPRNPRDAGLPSDKEVVQQLRTVVIEVDPDSFWPPHRAGVIGDGNYDAAYSPDVMSRTTPAGVNGIGAVAYKLANAQG